MRTYSERLANIKAKAQANKKAKRAIAASAVSLCALVLLIGGVMLHPALLLGQCFVPTVGPALQQPSVNDTPTDNTVPIHPGASEQDPTGPVIMGPTTPEDVLEFRYTSVKCPYGSSYSCFTKGKWRNSRIGYWNLIRLPLFGNKSINTMMLFSRIMHWSC